MPVPRSKKRDTTLYDLLEVSPDATSVQIAKVSFHYILFHYVLFF